MAYQYLTPDSITQTFRTSKQYTEGLTDKFREFERLAANKPHGSIPKEYPKTTDGTTASIIRKTPHRIIQQLPTGRVVSDKEDWLSIVASFIYTHKIIPSANEDYSLLQKCWQVVERFLTFGYCATYTPFVEHGGYFCTDLRLPYWGDVFIQPGKLSDTDSNYMFLRSWWQTKDIEALIEAQSKLKPSLRTWDITALAKIKDIEVSKDEKSKTPIEREQSVNAKGGIELITGFQRGIGATFYTFHMSSTGSGANVKYEGTIVRTKKNKDPRGELPISFAYGDIDGSNPFGRSIIELVGGLQNLMDAEMQMYQYNRALQLNPPLIKRGNFSKNNIKFAPNIIIDVGSDPNSIVEPLKIDTTALANFPNNYGLMKSQMLNLLASPDTSISGDIGNPGFSKTPQGVDASRANLSVDDNYVRQSFETWFERWSETAINIYFAEREGVEELQLDDETADALRGLDNFDQSLLSPDNKIRIDYSSATEQLTFNVNTSSSQKTDDPAQNAIASELLNMVMKYPMLNAAWGGPIDTDELARKIVESSSIADPEVIAPEPTQAQKQAKIDAKQKPNANSPMFDKPKLDIRYPDLPPAAQVQILGLAGINVTMQDVLEGPVVDPNMRGTINPIDDPNMLIPGGGPAQQTASQNMAAGPQGLVNPLQQDGVNLSPQEIQRLQNDPRFAQAQQTAALKQQAYSVQQPPQAAPPDQTQMTPDHVMKADQQAHQQELDKVKLAMELQQQQHAQAMAQKQHDLSVKQANKPQPKPAKVKTNAR